MVRLLLGASVLLFGVLGFDLELGRGEGAMFLGLLGVYVAVLFWQRRERSKSPVHDTATGPPDVVSTWRGISYDVGMLLVGLVLILGGSRVLVSTATSVAAQFGISEWVIGVTIVAAGTSVPELATSLVAAIKRSYGLSAGSLIGSDIFNILGVLGVAGVVRPMGIDVAARGSLIAMSCMIVLVLVFMRSGWRLSRTEGAVLLVCAAARWTYDLSLAP